MGVRSWSDPHSYQKSRTTREAVYLAQRKKEKNRSRWGVSTIRKAKQLCGSREREKKENMLDNHYAKKGEQRNRDFEIWRLSV